MKFFNLCLVVLIFITSSFSQALKVTNLSNKLYEITFISDQSSSPLCLLGPQEYVTHFEAFGKNLEFDKAAFVSIKIKQHGVGGPEIIWEKLPPETELIIPAEPLALDNQTTDKKSSYLQYLGNIASFTTYYGGILVSIPLGALVSMEPAAKLGAALAPSLLPRLALNVGGYTLFSPLHYFGSGFIGVIGGYAVGAVSGALLLPLAYSVVYKGTSAIVSYYTQEKEKPVISDEGKLEDSWVYLPSLTSEELNLEDWVVVTESQ